MTGSIAADPARLQVRQMRVVAGLLNATGSLEVDGQGNLAGRLQAELRAQARGGIQIGGTLREPQYRRAN